MPCLTGEYFLSVLSLLASRPAAATGTLMQACVQKVTVVQRLPGLDALP